jgi:hypothetical protein
LVEKYGHWRFAIPYDIGAAIVSYRLKLQFGIGEAQRSRLIAQPG